MNPYAWIVRQLGRTRLFAWLGPRIITPFDAYSHDHHIPRSTAGTGLPLAYLTTTGKLTGDAHTVPLLFVAADDGAVIVAGTNWGRHQQPDWVHNLRADPSAVLERDGVAMIVVARPLAGDEYDRFWQALNHLWPAYEAYRERAQREVAVFALDPV